MYNFSQWIIPQFNYPFLITSSPPTPLTKKKIVSGIGVGSDMPGNIFNRYSLFSGKAYKEKKR